MTAGAASLTRLVVVAHAAAQTTRDCATSVARQQDVTWRSTAALAYRRRLEEVSAQVRLAATQVDAVAVELQHLLGRLP